MHIPRKIAVVVLASVSVAGMAGASAATLGGLTAGQIGSEDAAIGACDGNSIASSFSTSYNATAQKYQVSAVNFTNVDALCNNKAASVSLRDAAGGLLTTQTVPAITVASSAFSIPIPAGINAGAVAGISIVISG